MDKLIPEGSTNLREILDILRDLRRMEFKECIQSFGRGIKVYIFLFSNMLGVQNNLCFRYGGMVVSGRTAYTTNRI